MGQPRAGCRSASRSARRRAARSAPTGSAAGSRRAAARAGRARRAASRAPVGPSSSNRARGVRGAISSWNGTRPAYGGDQHRVVVDRDDPLAPADLLLDQVGEQVAAHRPRRVGAEALALAGDRRGHEVERVQLRVGVRQRRAGLAALVDDQVDVGAPRGARASARATRRRRAATWSTVSSDSETTGSGELMTTSWAPRAGPAQNRSGLASGVGRRRSPRSAPGTGSAPRGRSSRACPERRRPGATA